MLQFIITGDACLDPVGDRPMPMPVGPFETALLAEAYMAAHDRIWGTWQVVPLSKPHPIGHHTS